MSALLEIHLAVGFLVVLCALVFSWNAMGARVMSAVVGLQILIGVVLAGLMGAALRGVGSILVLHVVLALLAAGAYGVSMPIRRNRGPVAGTVLGVLGLVFAVGALALGWHMAGRI